MDRVLMRVVLHPEGGVHIVLNNKQSCECSPKALMAALSDPIGFADRGFTSYIRTTNIINPKGKILSQIAFLTLITFYEDKRIICEFPELFEVFFAALLHQSDTMQLDLYHFKNCTSFQDEKQMFLRLYLELTQKENSEISIHRNICLPEETQIDVLRDICRTFYFPTQNVDPALPEERILSEESLLEPPQSTHIDKNIPAGYITAMEYAKKYNVSPVTLYDQLTNERLTPAMKDQRGRWHVDPNATLEDRRKNRKVQVKNAKGKKHLHPADDSYQSIQEWIKARKLFTDGVRPFIRTKEEARYYDRRFYHEVCWDGFYALIIDINPDYYCKSKKMTNRELIAAEQSPVVPNDESNCYHLHHIGQKADSPLAIIPDKHHNSDEYYSVFHQGSSGEEVHGNAFEIRKKIFWKKYIEMYDRYGGYKKIPFLNSKRKKDQR